MRHAGAARWAFNHAIGMKVAAHQEWRHRVQVLVDSGIPEVEARKGCGYRYRRSRPCRST
ncbi:hypothetical protein OG782_36995 [Streptomyces sp. NBC_00876]|uniref:hypothetical protein n=1 Tax=Streptomyces sp. NBC_00876 TaxID=2975853 RepID=UPI003869455F|nr:hypothetical protein OG782_36995 [Streptomyces sp. NBC_00876]